MEELKSKLAHRSKSMRSLKFYLGILGVVSSIHLAGVASNARAEDTQTSAVQLWYDRAMLSDLAFADALASDAQVKIVKWYNPIRIRVLLSALPDERATKVNEFVREFAVRVTQATNLPVSIVTDSSEFKANVFVIVDQSALNGIAANREEINVAYDEEKLRSLVGKLENSEAINCYFHAGTDNHGGVKKGLVVAPVAEDIYETEKCISLRLLQLLGLANKKIEDPNSALRVDSANVFPTENDLAALKLQYLPGVDDGKSLSAVADVADSAGVK